jgi:hypothetical protein
VTVWAAGAGAPRQLAQARTGANGHFALNADGGGDVLYLIAKGGHSAAQTKEAGDLALLAVVGSNPPSNVVINEFTTVASAFTAAQFIHGEAISGNPLGVRIAAGNVPNLVDLTTGHWGKVLVDPINSTQTATLATFDTLGSLVTAFFTVADDAWRGRFLKAASPSIGPAPTTTLEALADIAREPSSAPKELFSLFDQAYPQPADGSRRAAPFLPYLALVPPDFALSLCSRGAACTPTGGSCSTSKEICGAGRTGCPARNRGWFEKSEAAF